MDRQLNEIGTIPVTTSIIESLYPELKSANKKVTWKSKGLSSDLSEDFM